MVYNQMPVPTHLFEVLSGAGNANKPRIICFWGEAIIDDEVVYRKLAYKVRRKRFEEK